MSKRETVSTRAVTERMQQAFAEFSRDRNPMHVDAVAARRTQAGRPVVHGVHTLLWALEMLHAAGLLTRPPHRLRVKMPRWIYVGDPADLVAEATPNPAQLSIEVKGLPVMSVDLTYYDASPGPALEPLAPFLHIPRENSIEALSSHSGEAFVASAAACTDAFPGLSALIGTRAVGELAACSYVVGMEAPGLHSMFSKLDLTFTAAAPAPGLAFRVLSVDERFRKARIEVTGAVLSGTLEAFVRQPPAAQADLAKIALHVIPGEFEGMRALILGGSRGLGELTAKLIAVGGGSPVITYAVGRADAEALVAILKPAAPASVAFAYDVRHPAASQLATLGETPTHVFYFATNPIFEQRYEVYSQQVLADFMQFYVYGFYDLCRALLARCDSSSKLGVYYPSSIAVEDRPAGMTEYAMAKAAGEVLCQDMNQSLPEIRIISTRLPRLATDQTASIIPTLDADPLETMLPILRELMRCA